MSIASAAARTTVTSAASVSSAMRNETVRVALLEMQITQVNATAQSLGLYVPGAGLESVSTSVTFQRDDSADPSATTLLVTAWSPAPAGPSSYMRRWNSAASAGLGVVWTFPRAIVSQLAYVYNVSAGDVYDVSMTIDE